MRKIHSVVLVLVCVLFFGGAKQITAGQPKESRSKETVFASSLADGGAIRMKHSPVLGFNMTIAVRVDGVQAGGFSKGTVFEKFLTPGTHDLYVSRSGQGTGSYHSKLEVRKGETYSFVVKITSNKVLLQPTGRID